MTVRFIDFFAGIGGFRLGMERAGATCVGSCELAAFPRAVYAARFGAAPEWSDLCDVQAKYLPDADLWVGGFPCQDASVAGKQAGLLDGLRSGLVFRLLDLVFWRRPTWLLLENVPGLLAGRSRLDALLGRLQELGYVGAWRVLDAQHFGVPQRRRRVFLLARRARAAGPCPASVLLESGGGARHSRAVRAKGPQPAARAARGAGGGRGRRREDDENLVAAPLTAHHGRLDADTAATHLVPFDLAQGTHPENRARCAPGEPLGSLAVTSRPHVATGSWVRRLTVTECERVMGFPDGWTDVPGGSDTARRKALGNAVVPQVVEWITRRLRDAVFRETGET